MSATYKQMSINERKPSISIIKKVIKHFNTDNCTTMAAGIAFYSAFSLAPTVIIVLSILGCFYGVEEAKGKLFSRINGFIGDDAAAAIESLVQNTYRKDTGNITAIMSILLLIVGASATFSTLKTALNVIIPAKERNQLLSIALLIRMRLISFGLVLGIAFLLIVSLALDAVIFYIGEIMWARTPWVIMGEIVQLFSNIIVLAVAFTSLLKLLPDAKIAWLDAIFGGVVSAILFTTGKKMFAFYLFYAGTASAFGSASTLAALLMWLFFSAIVLLIGAEFIAARMGLSNRKDTIAFLRKVDHSDKVILQNSEGASHTITIVQNQK